ncbi:hypothetical protein MOQ72_21850 [Saccharopolyspora sp. K220]|uniref:hypothetical protein n=1 Tax=Saccharopolyspora soli TaxID=2926618 RepID=UPI001F578729|nr:hypothetical protein [Saccharopolyspora soli]MCI2420090.1 hypothetical protein [Saccharopolyspora soli]
MRSHLVNPLARRWTAFAGAVIASAAGILACTSQGAPPDSQESLETAADLPPSAPAAPSSAAADAAKDHATAAYIGMWQAMATAGETSDWQSPQLAHYATDNALTTITRSLYTDHFNRVVTQGQPKNNPQVTSVEPANAPETVVLSDCGDSSGTVKVFADSRRPINDKPGGRQSIVAEVKKQPDGAWRVTRFAVQGVGTC